MDHVVFSDQTEAVQKLKNIFGLGALDDIRDFAMTIAFPRKLARNHGQLMYNR